MVARDRSQSSSGPIRLIGYKQTIWGTGYTPYYGDSNPFTNQCVDVTNPGPPYTTGAGMVIRKGSVTHNLSSQYNFTKGVYTVNTVFQTRFHGTSTIAAPVGSFNEDLNYEGSKGWNKWRPGKPGASAGQLIGEMHRIPTLPGREILRAKNALGKARALGKEHINLEFGIKPIIRDIRRIHKITVDLDRLLRQLQRDNNKWVTRGGSIDTEDVTSTVNSTGTFLHPLPPAAFLVNPAAALDERVITLRSHSRSWFKARFKYHLKDFGPFAWQHRAIAELYGVNPNLSLLWELTPWSWLVDWHGNVGHILSNATSGATSDLVASYAYAMKHMFDTETCLERKILWTPSGNKPWTATSTKKVEAKVRQRASPFGFGLVPDDLDGRQMLILAALGVSRRW